MWLGDLLLDQGGHSGVVLSWPLRLLSVGRLTSWDINSLFLWISWIYSGSLLLWLLLLLLHDACICCGVVYVDSCAINWFSQLVGTWEYRNLRIRQVLLWVLLWERYPRPPPTKKLNNSVMREILANNRSVIPLSIKFLSIWGTYCVCVRVRECHISTLVTYTHFYLALLVSLVGTDIWIA